MTKTAPAAIKTDVDSHKFIDSDNFLKDPHARLPRNIQRRIDISSNLKVLLGELYGRICITGELMFKTETLARYCGLSVDKTKRAISEGRKKDMFVTEPTGSGLSYKLIDQKYPRLVDADSANMPYQVAQICPISYKEDNNSLKEKTTATQEPPSEKPDERLLKEPAAAQLDEYKKSIHPDIIAAGLSDKDILKHCDGVDPEMIIKASDKAIKPHVKNKVGYFIGMMRLKIVEETMQRDSSIKLERVPVPDFFETPIDKLKAIECYNRNCGHTTCTTILNGAKACSNCTKYCPFLNKGIQ